VGSLADPAAQNALRHLQVSELPAAAACPSALAFCAAVLLATPLPPTPANLLLPHRSLPLSFGCWAATPWTCCYERFGLN
jgi:hypothetical protein